MYFFKRLWRGLKLRLVRQFGTPKQLADYLYYLSFEKSINWRHPEDLNQWINWLAFKTDTTNWSLLADKYRMQDFMESEGFGKMKVPILATWESADLIDFTSLPNSFVLKCNNGSGDVMIIEDKSLTDIMEVRKYFREQMSRKFGIDSAEPHYLKIKPLIIAEQLLDVDKQTGKSSSLIDYKVWCFNGRVKCIYVCSDRNKEHYYADLYDVDWNNIAEGNIAYDEHRLKPKTLMSKPISLDEIISTATRLSKGLPELRLDFYEIDGKPYIGEFTLTSTCGRMTYYTDSLLINLGKECENAVEELLKSGELKVL